MEETKNYVRWSLLGLQGMFFAWVLAEVVLGLISVYSQYHSDAEFFQFDGSLILRILLGVMVIAMFLMGHFSYRRRMRFMQLDWGVVQKMNWYRKAFVGKMMFFSMAGFLTLVGYLYSHFMLWLMPWILSLYLIGRSFPFKPVISMELQLNEEEREMLSA
ncbi:MAG: hypothetical protein ACEPOZ_13525 [Marinifilaceae bacterium]